MDPFVFVAVLVAAACHAGWNASIKRTLDPLATTTLIAIGAGLVALPAIPFLGWPELPSWPWLIGPCFRAQRSDGCERCYVPGNPHTLIMATPSRSFLIAG